MLNICQLLNLTTQLDNTSLDQPITKQCFMLFSLCVKRALAIKEKRFGETNFKLAWKSRPESLKKFKVVWSLIDELVRKKE